jgi:formylglycine-generating enzyme required for sulfatase activity
MSDFRRIGKKMSLDDVCEIRTIPAGDFIMGGTEEDKFTNNTERPAHLIRFERPFGLGTYPVTVGEFRAFRPNHAPDQDDCLPVVNVTWQDARDYCEWLGAETGRAFHLPSEAEWEYACRAGSTTPFASGDDIGITDANFLYNEHGERVGRGSRTPAGAYAPNAFGLHDMHGNVCEWCADVWHPDYRDAPADGSPWLVDGDPALRVIRGGAWDYLPRLLRSAWRDALRAETRRDNLGFRVALTLN